MGQGRGVPAPWTPGQEARQTRGPADQSRKKGGDGMTETETDTATPPKMIWEIDYWPFLSSSLTRALEDGWEPFAVVPGIDPVIWVRRQVPA